MPSANAAPAGFLNINKPPGLTSHDVVAKIRRGLKLKKVGHAGTLDPMATGVLVLCVGYATRLSEYAMSSVKGYHARVHLGIETTTYDTEGETIATYDPAHITRADLEALLPQFTGDLQQLPPIYSAIKQGGRKLYELARAGQSADLKPRPVTIHTLRLAEWSPPCFSLEVTCGAGTYIRSLAHDIGRQLGVGAHLCGLVRVASGAFSIKEAISLDDLLAQPGEWQNHLLSPDAALSHFPALHLDAAHADDVLYGRPVPLLPEHPLDMPLARVYSPQGRFLALLKLDLDVQLWRPHKVFHNET